MEAHVAEFRFAKTEITESEGEMLAVRIQLRQDLGGVAIGEKAADPKTGG